MKNKAPLKTKKVRRYLPAAIAAVVIIALVVGGGLVWKHHHDTKAAKPAAGSSGSSGSTNLNPPTEQEKQDTDQHKDDLTKPPTPPPTDSSGKTKVTPIISYADRTTVNAYVPGVFEEGGTCTATLTQGSQTITKTSTGFGNASYTQCPPISFSGTNLGSGDWSVTVSYSSSKAQGVSQATTIH